MNHFLSNKNPKPYLKVILDLKYKGEIPSTCETQECLLKNKQLKLEYLDQGHIFNFSYVKRYTHTQTYNDYIDEGAKFYDDMTKEELLQTLKITNILEHKHSPYFQRVMTWDEMCMEADRNQLFRIRYAKDLGYGYFKKVEYLFEKDKTEERHRYFKRPKDGRGLTAATKKHMREVREIIENHVKTS
jgi:hypothetical protein